MLLVKRTIRRTSGRYFPTAFYLINGDYRSAAYPTLISLVTEASIEMYFNPDFTSPTNSKVTFEALAEAPILNHSIFLSNYPEFFL
jgi:hypothetical protein